MRGIGFTGFLVCMILFFIPPSLVEGAIPASERAALIALYNSTNGDGWSGTINWKTPPLDTDGFAMPGTEDTWTGITVTNILGTDHVRQINLSHKNMAGPIPTQMGNLSSLSLLFLNDNQLTGNIPPELGNLSDLEWLYLYNNQLTGNIPPELGNLSNLLSLILNENQLTGNIPPELGNLSNLEKLYLYNNQLTGSIPPELGNLSNLEQLYLYVNQLTGSIPTELGNLSNLQWLYLYNNQLTGSIPPQLGNLSNLQRLDLYNNQLTGNIPPELGNLSNLQWLYLHNNQLTGSIPPQLGNLSNLQWLYLHNNQLTGSIPPQLGNLSNLSWLLLNNNQLTGSIPPELGNLSNLERLDLYSNQLTGSIPPELGNLLYLERLNLYNNQLTGSIPPELGNLSNLGSLELSYNQLTGSIPPQLGNLSNLSSLLLNNNQLSGSIPPELGNLSNLSQLYLYFNQLTGSIPPELGNLSNLQWLYLNNNQLTGSIPAQLGNLSNLQVLGLYSNQLTGSIPAQLGNLSNLMALYLQANRFTGSIPTELGNLSNLQDSNSDFRYNGIYTNDNTLRNFLNLKQTAGGDWESTQTTAPANAGAGSPTYTSIRVSWTPIIYTGENGGYRVLYSTTPGGPYTYFGITANKSASLLDVTGLNPGTTYYFVVQTRTDPHVNNSNTVDSEYSTEVSATALPLTIPTVTTAAVSNITSDSAGSGGDVTSEGGSAVTARGVCWSTAANPTTADNTTSDGTGTGNFTSSITGLAPGTTYHIRAYAVNSVGTAYGVNRTFTTGTVIPTVTTHAVSNIQATSASCGVSVTSDGGAAVTAKGVCWSTTTNPTTADNKTNNGTGTGSAASSITGLSPGTTYYARAYAVNSVGTAYGIRRSFTTLTAVPTVTTHGVSNIQVSTALCGVTVSSDGGAAVTAKGVCWSTAANPTTADNKTDDGTGTGSATSTITGLSPATTYHVRAYAVNSVETAYGINRTFTTAAATSAVTTHDVSNIQATTALCGVTVSSDGGAAVTAKGVCWSTTANPTTAGNKTNDGTGTGSATSAITGLSPGTTYHVRAYADNGVGTAYGDNRTFTTLTTVPAVTTAPVYGITSMGASCGGNIANDGGVPVTARGVCWNTAPNPTTADYHTHNGDGTGAFTSSIPGLNPGKTYYVRAYAVNSRGTSYGGEKRFTTPVDAPLVETGALTGITAVSALCEGIVENDGGLPVTARGVCWSTSANPTTTGNHTNNGEGAGFFTSSITGLEPATTYHVRAYAVNSAGTSYGADQSFTTLANPSISGRVSEGGTGLPGVTLTFSNGGGFAYTDASGNYSQTVPIGWSGSVTPGKDGFTFSPASRSYTGAVSEITGQDFSVIGFAPVISGRVEIFIDDGIAGLSGAVLTFQSENGDTVTVVTNINGEYSHTVPYGWTGTVTPRKTGYRFSPSAIPYDSLTASAPNRDYSASQRTVPLFSLSGYAAEFRGGGISGVILGFSDDSGTTYTFTRKNGIFNHTVEDGWSGRVTPLKSGYKSRPPEVSIEPVHADLTRLDFVFNKSDLEISGQIIDDEGFGVTNVEIIASSPAAGGGMDIIASTFSDFNGNYRLTVPHDWTGEVKARKDRYEFESFTRWYENCSTDLPGQDYTAVPHPPYISGQITDERDAGIAGVLLTFSNGGGISYSNANGDFKHPVEPGWSGTVTLSKTGYTFTPSQRPFNNVTTNLIMEPSPGQSDWPKLEGIITTPDGMGVEGVMVEFLGGTGFFFTYTDTNGNYSQVLEHGWSGTVTPSKINHQFEPLGRTYEHIGGDQPAQDYTAAPVPVFITGKVITPGGEGVANVILSFSPNGGSAITGKDGYYLHSLPYQWAGRVTLSAPGYELSPSHRDYEKLINDLHQQDYTAIEKLPVISGRVTTGSENIGLAGVTIFFYGEDGITYRANTKADGTYSHKVPKGWSGTLVPQKNGYRFLPPSQQVTDVISDRPLHNFTAVATAQDN